MINWAPTLDQEIVQNVNTLLVTGVGDVPLARSLGTPQDVVDSPVTTAAALLQAAVIKAVRVFEPRAKVARVRLEHEVEGQLVARCELVPA